MTHGLCPDCGGLKRLDDAGLLAFHHIAINVTRRAVKTVGSGRVRRRCPGSGRPPKGVEK